MACVRKRSGKWVADYRDHNGKRHWETFDTRKEAEQVLARHTTAIRDGKYCPANDKRTVADAHDSWRVLCVEGSDNKGGKPLRLTTQGHYSLSWRLHVAPRWGAMKLRQVDAEAIARWKQEKLDAGVGVKTLLGALQLLGSVFRHARRFGWTSANPLQSVHRPHYRSKVAAFTPAQIAALLDAADADTALFIRLAASTGLRFGELAGLRWADVDLGKGIIEVRQQYTAGAWSDLKTANARRSIPLPGVVRDELKARYAALCGNVARLGPDGRTVFTSPEGGPLA